MTILLVFQLVKVFLATCNLVGTGLYRASGDSRQRDDQGRLQY